MYARSLGLPLLVSLLAFVGTSVVAQDVESEGLGPGERFSHRFDVAGEAQYHCHPHPRMEGTITIQPSDGAAPRTHVVEIVEPSADPSSWAFSPASLTIQAGDTVEWINKGQREHLIMAWVGEDAGAMHHDDHGDGEAHAHESPAAPIFGFAVLALALVATLRRR